MGWKFRRSVHVKTRKADRPSGAENSAKYDGKLILHLTQLWRKKSLRCNKEKAWRDFKGFSSTVLLWDWTSLPFLSTIDTENFPFITFPSSKRKQKKKKTFQLTRSGSRKMEGTTEETCSMWVKASARPRCLPFSRIICFRQIRASRRITLIRFYAKRAGEKTRKRENVCCCWTRSKVNSIPIFHFPSFLQGSGRKIALLFKEKKRKTIVNETFFFIKKIHHKSLASVENGKTEYGKLCWK